MTRFSASQHNDRRCSACEESAGQHIVMPMHRVWFDRSGAAGFCLGSGIRTLPPRQGAPVDLPTAHREVVR